MNNDTPTSKNSQTPQPEQAPLQPAQSSQNISGDILPPSPINSPKQIRLGWIFVGISAAVFTIALFFGYVLGLTAILAAYAGSLGIRYKSKALAITGFTLGAIFLVLYILAITTQ